MTRLSQLLIELGRLHPADPYFKEMAESTRQIPEARSQIATYNKTLQVLDLPSWSELKGKALNAFMQVAPGRGRRAFFDQLNEAFAYRHLLQHGNLSVSFLPESKTAKSPDISYINENKTCFCEVKTIHISEEEIERFKSMEAYSNTIYLTLSEEFLTKLASTIKSAYSQVQARGEYGMVYAIVNFDDFTLSHYPTYRRQITAHLRANFPNREVYLKVGIQGRKHVHHNPPGKTQKS